MAEIERRQRRPHHSRAYEDRGSRMTGLYWGSVVRRLGSHAFHPYLVARADVELRNSSDLAGHLQSRDSNGHFLSHQLCQRLGDACLYGADRVILEGVL